LPPPPPDDPEDPWLPPPLGGGGGVCTTCEPGDDPYENDGDELCALGEIAYGNGGCIGEAEPEPCEGNPVKNPRIAEQNNIGINGGRWGDTRSEGEQFHSGLDLKNDVGNPWFSPVDGNIDAVAVSESRDLGYYVTIRFQKNGVYYTMQFGHLQNDSWPPNGSTISAGDVIGIQGVSGNLDRAIRQGATNDIHSHIIVRKRTGTGWNTKHDYGDPLNPEQFIKTKFDANGSPVAETDC